MNEPAYRYCDPWEPFPYCDCGRLMRHGYCPECDQSPAPAELKERGFPEPTE